eukprot:m.8990 g.8990  ORF g.8990 m.8990 type:complete len:522 (-) comp3989_c0_seq1:108-1673(-)
MELSWRNVLSNPKWIAYGSSALFLGLIHNLFLIYHVELFISVYRISEAALWWGELVFLIWNCTNDFILGWISDSTLLSKKEEKGEGTFSSRVNIKTITDRLRGVSVGGPLMCLSFLLLLVPWPFIGVGLQFTLSLCLYDGFLTWVDLSHNALLADLASTDDERTAMNLVGSIFSALGSMSVFLSFAVWEPQNLTRFRAFSFFMATMSGGGFIIAAKNIHNAIRKEKLGGGKVVSETKKIEAPLADTDDIHPLSPQQDIGLLTFSKEIAQSPNFLWFSLLSLVQTFHCHFNSNFFPMFLTVLLGDHLSPFMQSALLGFSFIAPHFNNVYFSMLVSRFGSYHVIQGLVFTKICLSLLVLLAGLDHWILVCLFVASNRIFTEGTCKLLNLVVSDLVDEDYLRHNRSRSVSALIFGTNALLSKPGQTLAPVIGTYYIARSTGASIFTSDTLFGGDIKSADERMSSVADKSLLKNAAFNLLVAVPMICGIIQSIAWLRYSLHGKELKKLRTSLKQEEELLSSALAV